MQATWVSTSNSSHCKKIHTNSESGNWGPVNCDLGSSDVCKFSGDGNVDEAATKPLDEWCKEPPLNSRYWRVLTELGQSKDRTGTDLTGKVVEGGKLVCTDTKPGNDSVMPNLVNLTLTKVRLGRGFLS